MGCTRYGLGNPLSDCPDQTSRVLTGCRHATGLDSAHRYFTLAVQLRTYRRKLF